MSTQRRVNKPRESRGSRIIDQLDLPLNEILYDQHEYDVEYLDKHDLSLQRSDFIPSPSERNIKSKSIFNNECKSLVECDSINRIISCLKFYQKLDLNNDSNLLIEYLNQNNYPFLLNDYNHILIKHLGDNKSTQETRKEFEAIHVYIMSQIESCELEKCQQLHRNSRDREKDSESALIQPDDNQDKDLFNFYVDYLDTIHCFLVHTFDIGHRLKSDEINLDIDDNKEEENIQNEDDYIDHKMGKLKEMISLRRKRFDNIRGRDSRECNKFNTNKEENNNSTTNEQKGKFLYCHVVNFKVFFENFVYHIQRMKRHSINSV